MRPLLLALSCVLVVAPLSRTDALIFGSDRRMNAASAPGSLFGPVGIVYGGNGEYATAFLIDDCRALTVQHVFGEDRTAKGRRIIAAFGVAGAAGTWTTTRATVVADGAIERNRASGIGARVNDWALLRLSRCLGRKFGHVRLTSRLPGSEEAIAIAGYPSDRPFSDGLAVDMRCHLRGLRSLTILHDCAALPGNSGSPMFRIAEEKGKPVLEVFAMSEAAHSANDLGSDVMEARDNYPDAVWNIATALCRNPSLAPARLPCELRSP